MDFDATPGPLDRASRASVLVEGHAFVLERRMHRRQLVDRSAEAAQHGCHLFRADLDRPLLQHLAFGIGGRRRDTESDRCQVFLVGIEHRTGELGALPQEDQQQA